MRFDQLPVIFLSYKEDNADRHWEALKTQVPYAHRVHGVKGFDAAHKEAARLARNWASGQGIDLKQHPYFVTVDGDNTVLPSFWRLETETMRSCLGDYIEDFGRMVLSWNAYNPVTGLAYGNGGVKLWGYDFIANMETHERAEKTTVDFCWLPGYKQMHAIHSVTNHCGSPVQAFTAGFREGAKMLLINGGETAVGLYTAKDQTYPTNLERLMTWCSVGAHHEYGEWSVLGALIGFSLVHIQKTFKLEDVSDLDKVHDYFTEFGTLEGGHDATAFKRTIIEGIKRLTDVDIPVLGAKQSAFVVHRTRPLANNNSFELETWTPKFDPRV